jgi:hypothetical protein
MDRKVSVNITFDPASYISDKTLFSNWNTTGLRVTAEIRFCVHFGLKTWGPTPIEVNSTETQLVLTVDLTDGFEIVDIAYQRLPIHDCCVLLSRVNDALISNLTPINQGTAVRVCVTPGPATTSDGIKIRSIKYFTWSRTLPSVVTQAAIIDRDTVAANQLTNLILSCRGFDICSFETILYSNFYTYLGLVVGSGVASVQFGNNTGRRLHSCDDDDDDDDWYDGEDHAGFAEFKLNFSMVTPRITPPCRLLAPATTCS